MAESKDDVEVHEGDVRTIPSSRMKCGLAWDYFKGRTGKV